MTANEQKTLARLKEEREQAELAVSFARHAIGEAQKAHSIARREYKRALDALVKFWEEKEK